VKTGGRFSMKLRPESGERWRSMKKVLKRT
jgi:hypothetical protein